VAGPPAARAPQRRKDARLSLAAGVAYSGRGPAARREDAPLSADVDPHFYDRADALIELANAQLAGAPRGQVGDSGLYAMARFNAWLSASGHASGTAMAAARAQILDDSVSRYRQMLEANLDDYIAHFEQYMHGRRD